MDSSFQLAPAENERIYSKIIEPTSFLGTSSSENPKMIIVAAQTGAGKTKIVEAAVMEFTNKNVVIVNTDDVRAYHPRFDEIVMLNDKESAGRTHHDASTWRDQLLARCIKTRRNIILEGVFKDSKNLTKLTELAKNNGYEVTVRVVAVHERFSIWGIFRRYEKEKIVRGHGRYVPIEYHDECYQKLPKSIESIEEQKVVDQIEVYDRDGNVLYSNELLNGDWTAPPNCLATIESERNRLLSVKEHQQYIGNWSKVFEYMQKRGAPPEEIVSVNALSERLIKELRKNDSEGSELREI